MNANARHSPEWSAERDLTDKRVAFIDNGSTGGQLLAPVACEAKRVHLHQRTSQWIAPRPHSGDPVGSEVRWLLDTRPEY